jgi:hypothetical protein
MKSLLTDMHFNLVIYCAIAFFTALNASFSTDEAAKYISPTVLFWLRTTCSSLTGTLLAAKLFLSTSYADWQAKRRAGSSGSGDTEHFSLPAAVAREQTAGVTPKTDK